MSDSELPIRFADTAQAAMDASKSAGQLMREAREAQGLHVAALAVSLKVPVKKLEALEADRLEELPDAVFIRALASSVCRALKIDPEPILSKLPKLNSRVLDPVDQGVNVAFRTRGDGPAPSALASLNRPVVFAVVALLLAAIILMLLPDFKSRTDSVNAASGSVSAANEVVKTEPVNNPVAVATTPTAGADSSTVTIAADESTTMQLSTPTLSVTPALSTPSVVSPTAVIQSNAELPTVPQDAIVVFSATGETWIEVRDSGGKILLQRTLQAGQQTGIGQPAKGELSVVVGRANLTQVTVRGKAFDLTPVSSKDAVARFQVK